MTKIGTFFFKARSYTPVPFIPFIIYFAHPTTLSIILGFISMVCGEAIRFWGVGYAGFATRTRNVGASKLVTNGAFSVLRNPLYAGNFFISLGVVIAFNALMPYMVFIYAALYSIQYYFIVKLEEERLEDVFGDEYRRYKAAVPRFIPTFRKYEGASDVPFSGAVAIKNEKKVFVSILIMLIVALLLNLWKLKAGTAV
ncbi:MAG: isoprenylcysteine carboxylmethyltransferase family protein [Fibrobacteres bacterium]|nr:isoprenylcysteine carboxylmethyltransferase family protein [Fibrobacterota bacterium]